MSLQPSSLQLTFLNQGICDATINDCEVADQIRIGCPAGTYSWLEVRSINHQFATDPSLSAVPSRLIQFTPTSFEATKHIVSIIFGKTKIETPIGNRVALGLLGSNDLKDQAEVRSAFWQNFTVKLFIAMDGSYNYDIFPEQGITTKLVTGPSWCAIV